MSGFADLFLDTAFETLIAERGTTDTEGTFTPDGYVVSVPARFEGQSRQVRRPEGQVVQSSVQAIVLAAPGFSAGEWRFTIPDRFTPHARLTAIAVGHESDEHGPAYEEVLFP